MITKNYTLKLNDAQATTLLRVVGILLSGLPSRMNEMGDEELSLVMAIRDDLAQFRAQAKPQKKPVPKQRYERGPKELEKLLRL